MGLTVPIALIRAVSVCVCVSSGVFLDVRRVQLRSFLSSLVSDYINYKL